MNNFLAILSLCTPAFAQSITPLAQSGDVVPGVGAVTSIDNFALNATGDWLVEADTDHPNGDADAVLLANGSLLLREGQVLGAPAGATLDSFDSVTLNVGGNSAWNFFLDGPPTGFDSGVYYGTSLLFQEGDSVADPSISPGSPYRGFFDVKLNRNDQLLVIATIDDAAINSTVDQALIVIDATGGSLQSTSVLWKEGDVLPGQSESIVTFGTGPHQSSFNQFGSVLFFADLSGDTAVDGVIYLNSTLIAQEGSPAPVAGRNWETLSSPEMDLNDAGDIVFSGNLDGDTTTDQLIVVNNSKFRQEGDTLPAIAPFVLTSFGTAPLSMDDQRQVLWYGEWNDPDTDRNSGLFLQDTLLVQEGVTTIGGVVVDTLRGVQDGYVLSPSGDFALFEAILADGTQGAYRIDLGLGMNYCPSLPNSASPGGAIISGLGSASVSQNNLTLSAQPVPGGVSAIFYYGPGAIQTPFGDGFRCVGGQTQRLPIGFASAGGVLSSALDLANPPQPSGQITSGSTWYFQAWYRDNAFMQTGFNLSNGLELTFGP